MQALDQLPTSVIVTTTSTCSLGYACIIASGEQDINPTLVSRVKYGLVHNVLCMHIIPRESVRTFSNYFPAILHYACLH